MKGSLGFGHSDAASGTRPAGVPPDIEAPIFPKEDLADRRDSALDKALELLEPVTSLEPVLVKLENPVDSTHDRKFAFWYA